MGASVNEGIFSTPDFNINSQFDDDRRSLKPVYDNVHGNIYLNPICLKFVDTEQFQRLRDLKQLGLSNMVYPGAVHSRFEHSLGVYWLAGEAVQQLKADQGQELDINRFDIQTVKLAGLLHDIGHGPFSHLFEREFLPRVGVPTWSHEDMSAKLVDYMVDENSIEIPDDMLKKAKGMILASSETGFTSSRSSGEKHFLYDIVANGRNGIDVDKFDYIVRDSRACGLGCNFQFKRLMENMRVIDDEICYRAKEYLTIHKLFYTRADLYRTVYTHPKIKAIEMMFVDALVKANSYLNLSSKVNDPSEYWKLDDTILKNIEVSTDPELKESRDLIRRIRKRNLYQFCNDYVVPKEQIENFRDITAKDIICSQKSSGVTLREEDVAVCNVKIDLSRGMRNPLESINFFQDYDSDEKFPISDHQVSNLLPTFSQDKIVRVYAKKDELVKDIADAFVNFQEKTFGRTVQICATPEKKKRKRSDHRGNALPRTLLKFL